MSRVTKTRERRDSVGHKVFMIVGIVLCVILGFFLICNITIIIKGLVNPDVPPSVFGTTPMAVTSSSMSGKGKDHIEKGDLIFINKTEVENLEDGDIICFLDKEMGEFVTHRIVRVITDSDGEDLFITKGDTNTALDRHGVPKSDVIGIYNGKRIAKIGGLMLFLQSPIGMITFIAVLIIALILYYILRKFFDMKKKEAETRELEEEAKRLRRAVKGPKDDLMNNSNDLDDLNNFDELTPVVEGVKTEETLIADEDNKELESTGEIETKGEDNPNKKN